MNVLVVTGIFPPDIGGPATHADDIRTELIERRHRVAVLTLTDASRTQRVADVVRYPRAWPWPVRSTAVLAWIVRHRPEFEVVYATGLVPVAVAGARVARRPVIAKMVTDPAWERARRRGLTTADFDRFQRSAGGGIALRAMRALRNWSARAATRVVTPSMQLADAVRDWSGRDDVVVIPNGVRGVAPPVRDSGRAGTPLRLAFIGRLVPVKHVDVLVEALVGAPRAELQVIGDGPERARLTRFAAAMGVSGQVEFTRAVPHETVMRRLADVDALVLASEHEGLPHVVLEALACGVPVISSPLHGVAGVITHGLDGLVIERATPSAYSEVFRQLVDDPALLARLRAGARASAGRWSLVRAAEQLEGLFEEVVRQRTPNRP